MIDRQRIACFQNLFLASICALLVSSCSVAPRVYVFNNTREPIAVADEDRELIASPGESLDFVFGENVGSVVVEGQEVERFPFALVPEEYVRTGWFRAAIYVRIESGALMYLESPRRSEEFSVTHEQPPGWPVHVLWRNAGRSNKPLHLTAEGGRR